MRPNLEIIIIENRLNICLGFVAQLCSYHDVMILLRLSNFHSLLLFLLYQTILFSHFL